jgi:hypothetical protein
LVQGEVSDHRNQRNGVGPSLIFLQTTTPRATLKEIFAHLDMLEIEGMDKETEKLSTELTREWNKEVWNRVEAEQR